MGKNYNYYFPKKVSITNLLKTIITFAQKELITNYKLLVTK